MLSLTIAFVVLAVVGLVVGLLIPKTWECSASLVPDTNTIKTLIDRGGGGSAEGRSAAMVQMIQTVQTRKIGREVLEFGGWLTGKASAQDEERLLRQLRSRLRVENARDMIRVTYRDSDAKRTFVIASKMVEILVREAANAKETSSREAYEFIERQVKDYGKELALVHDRLLAYYRSESGPVGAAESEKSTEDAATGRDDTRRSHSTGAAPEELARLRDEETTLTAQLERARPAQPTRADFNRSEEQLRARVEQLRIEHEHLVNTYTDNHPDVVRKANDLESARQDLRQLEAARLESEKARAATAALDEQVTGAARVRLETVRAQLAALGAQPRRSGRLQRRRTVLQPSSAADANMVDPDMRRVGQDSKLSELLRRYETTRDVYQDLLKKRETARLDLNLDVERSSVILKVQEPPAMPVIASGLRVMHKSLVAIVLAVAVPIGLLVAMVSFDGRIRSSEQIERLARVQLLVSIPYVPSTEGQRRRTIFVVLLLLFVLVAYVITYLISQSKVVG
jgi:uncharacterized protein involved in exopolysaccharide biosynthesis